MQPVSHAQTSDQDHFFTEGFEDQDSDQANEFGDFFQMDDNLESYGDGSDQAAEYSDSLDFIENYLGPTLAESPDWQALYSEGYTYADAARLVFSNLVDAEDQEVDDFLADITADLSPQDAENFFKSLGRIARAAAPIVSAVAPIVGTAIGGPAGGLVGGFLGQAAGRLTRGRQRSRSPRRPRPRYRKPAMGRSGFGRYCGATAQLVNLLQNPRIQRMLLNANRNMGSLRTSSGETMSASAVLTGLHGGIVESMQEMQENGIDIDQSDADFSPADFSDAGQAFHTLTEFVASTQG